MAKSIDQHRRDDNRHDISITTYKHKKQWMSSKLRCRDGPNSKERTKRNQIQQSQQQHEQNINFDNNLQTTNSWKPMTYIRHNRRTNKRSNLSKIIHKKIMELYTNVYQQLTTIDNNHS